MMHAASYDAAPVRARVAAIAQQYGGPALDVALLAISELLPYVAGTVRVDIEGRAARC